MSSAKAGRAIFRFPNFRFYVTARFLWGLAMQIQTVAVAWYIYDVTRSYSSVLWTQLPACLLAAVLFMMLGRYPDEEAVT